MTTDSKECQFCCSPIPIKAAKCKFCMEWQDEVGPNVCESPSEEPVGFSDRFPELRKLFQWKIVEWMPLHYTVSVLLFGVLIFAAIQFLWYRLDEDNIYLLSFLVFTLQMMFSWSGLIWIYNVIKDNYPSYVAISSQSREDAERTIVEHHERMFSPTRCILVGVIAGVVACAGDHMVGLPFNTVEARVIYAVFEFINMFFAGAGIYSMLMYALFVHKMSSDAAGSSPRMRGSECIVNIGKVHLRTCIIGIGPLCLGIIARLFGEFSWELRILMWYGSFAIVIILYIYWPMLNIHRLMKRDIERQMSLIQRKLQETLIDIRTSQSVRSIVRLSELRRLEKSISKESTWPFDPKNVSAVFSAVGFPILLMIIDKLWSF